MKMTVVVPSYQRHDHLVELIDSLGSAMPGASTGDVELVVVLDGSTDGSKDMLEGPLQVPFDVRCIWQENAGAAASRNRGVVDARGDVVWFLDDDMRVTREAVEAHLGWDREVSPILMGPCVIDSTDSSAATARDWYDERWRRLAATGVVGDPVDLTFANASMPVEVARRFAFDPAFRGYGGEDLELAVRILEAEIPVRFDPEARVVHEFTPSWRERLRKLREEGANRLLLLRLHPNAADLVFDPEPRRLEAAFRRLSETAAGRALWFPARILGRLGQAPLPPRARIRLQLLAELAALYAGVSEGRRLQVPEV